MPVMGFLNPWLYTHPTVLTDITEGDNAIGRGGNPAPYGFNCTKGYDPVTGLGTPNFPAMLEAALATRPAEGP
jgi:tripeptidyl-peptidase-1